MADSGTFLVELMTPEKTAFREEATMVVIPGIEGEFAVLRDHCPLITALKPGTIEIHTGSDSVRRLQVETGFVEVLGAHCTILTEQVVETTQ